MNELITQKETFDFQSNKVEIMDLSTLKRTHMEDDYEGNPLRGLYHFQAIENVVAICNKYNLNFDIEEIFAAHNNSKHLPGVTVLKKEEMVHGEKSVGAHILRRIFTTIRINDYETDELTTTIVLTYHQDGIQAAIGPCVKACHNQCILSAERIVSNYGKNKVATEQLFDTVDQWLSQFETQMTEDRERIRRLKNTGINIQEVYTCIGLLTALRVAHDSSDEELSGKVENYPLNQSQISAFTEDVLKKMKGHDCISAWDMYNIATEYYKPERTSIPSLILQNAAFAATLDNFCRLKNEEIIDVDAVMVS
ncbi:MAG: DUF932 domain-containing protein [Tannerellaceae bacterium]|jgi:hypothetical protein|nr:DUF932 domain-containing protein [Tannerellaceae bacterium]